MSIFPSNIEIQVVRYLYKDDAVLGRLFLNGIYLCDTLEPPVRDKYGCIDLGIYTAKIVWSRKFSSYVLLLNVDGRSGIEFHVGNIPEETKGCILVGYNYPSPSTSSLMHSKPAFYALLSNLFNCDNVCFNVTVTYDESFLYFRIGR